MSHLAVILLLGPEPTRMTSNEFNCDLWNFLNNISQQLESLLDLEQTQQDVWSGQNCVQFVDERIATPSRKSAVYASENGQLASPIRQADVPVRILGPSAQQVNQSGSNFTNHEQGAYYQSQPASYGIQSASNLQTQPMQLEMMNEQSQGHPKVPLGCAYCEWLARCSSNQPIEDSNFNHSNDLQVYRPT